jgi:uncharacterized protein YdaU (DUF1376 family)
MKEYFSHDYNSRIDRKMVNLQMKHGMTGVGIYWCLVEIAYENNGMIPSGDCERIAFELRTEYERIKSVLEDFELFYQSNGFYRSESIDRRLQEREEKSASARKSINARWGKPKDQQVDTNVLRTNDKRNTIKEKESKVKEKKEDNKIGFKHNVKLTQKEYDTFLKDHGEPAIKWMIEKLSAYKEAKGKTYKSDAGAIRSWVIEEWEKKHKYPDRDAEAEYLKKITVQ